MSKRADWLRKQKRLASKKQDLKALDESRAAAIYKDLHAKQKYLVDDTFKTKAVLTPRRSGKTHAAGALAVITALRNPGVVIPIICLSKETAKRYYWDDILTKFDEQYGLNLKSTGGLHATSLIATFENGSKLILRGAETLKEAEKLRGGKYFLAIIDECKSFNPDVFTELVDEIMLPALLDSGGTLVLIGTPGAILSGPFYNATYENYRDKDGMPISRDAYHADEFWDDENNIPQWSFHHWTSEENTACPNLWQDALVLKKQKRWADDNPKWTREYLGKWVSTKDAMVFAYNTICETDGGAYEARCTWHPNEDNKWGLPEDSTWRFVMGIDLGYEDDFGLVIGAYSEHRDCLYLVEDFKAPHLNISEVAEVIQGYIDKYEDKIEAMVADTGGSAKQIVVSLNEMYGFSFEKAEKREKPAYIELLNSDLYDGKIKIPTECNLSDEWRQMQWKLGDKTKAQLVRYGKLEVDRRCADHCADAFLYLWRLSLHHFSREREKEVEPESQEFYDKQDRADADAAVARRDAMLAARNEMNVPSEEDWMEEYIGPDDAWKSTNWMN